MPVDVSPLPPSSPPAHFSSPPGTCQQPTTPRNNKVPESDRAQRRRQRLQQQLAGPWFPTLNFNSPPLRSSPCPGTRQQPIPPRQTLGTNEVLQDPRLRINQVLREIRMLERIANRLNDLYMYHDALLGSEHCDNSL